jgi:mitofilin
LVSLDGEQLTNEELNSLLIHAHKRVLQLQKQIEKMQLTQNQQIQAALSEQQRQNSELQKQNEANLYSLHRKEFELEKDKTVIDLN